MKARLIAVTVFICTFISQRGFCWGNEGHSIVALIAQKVLTQESQSGDAQATQTLAAINNILGGTAIDEAATWPDKVKSLARECRTAPYDNRQICAVYKATSNWHFVNVDSSSYTLDPSSKEYRNGDLVVLIKGLTHLLKGENTDLLSGVPSFTAWKLACAQKADHPCKKEALEFLIHFVGDIHQPLHAGASCDEGGNLQLITFFGQSDDPLNFWCKNSKSPTCQNYELHEIWDTDMIVHDPANYTSNDAYADKLIQTLDGKQQSSDPTKCVTTAPTASVDVDGANGPISWVDESICYMPQVYSFPDDPVVGSQSGGQQFSSTDGSVPNRCDDSRKSGEGWSATYSQFAVGPLYYKANLATINERLYWAGERLATLLKNIFGDGDQASSLLN